MSCFSMDMFVDVEEQDHVCRLCKVSFTNRSGLDRHLLRFHGIKSHDCDTCRTSSREKILESTFLKYTGEGNHTCNVCNKTFARKIYLEAHAMTHREEKAYVCNICNSAFHLQSSLSVHTLLCSYDKYFTDPDVNLLEDDPDDYFFDDLPSTRTQSISTTLSKLLVPQHQLVQTGEKPKPEKRHVCDVCKKAFSSLYGLNRHLVFSRRHLLRVCRKSVSSSSALNQHSVCNRAKHVCNVCPNKKRDLRKYFLRQGKGGKLHVCDFCMKPFHLKCQLEQHLATHTEERLASAMNRLALIKTSEDTLPHP